MSGGAEMENIFEDVVKVDFSVAEGCFILHKSNGEIVEMFVEIK